MQPRPGILIVALHEAINISLPEDYKQILEARNRQQGSEPTTNTVPPQWTGHSYKFDVVSHLVDFSVHLYLKNALSALDSGRIQDVYLGVARFRPRFEEGHIGKSTTPHMGMPPIRAPIYTKISDFNVFLIK